MVKAIARVPANSENKPNKPVHIVKVVVERVGPVPPNAPEVDAGSASHADYDNKDAGQDGAIDRVKKATPKPRLIHRNSQFFVNRRLAARLLVAAISNWRPCPRQDLGELLSLHRLPAETQFGRTEKPESRNATREPAAGTDSIRIVQLLDRFSCFSIDLDGTLH